MKEQTSRQALEALGISLEQAVLVDDSLRERPKTRDGRICICGHSKNRHKLVSGEWICVCPKFRCKCKSPNYVLEVSDTRPFTRKTKGSGMNHALYRALAANAKSEKDTNETKSVVWLVSQPLVCMKPNCNSTGGVLVTPVSEFGIAVEYESSHNAFLCVNCRGNQPQELSETESLDGNN
jgi:hypothetical protein